MCIRDRCRETVDKHDVVAFIKGTRKEPECGFSHRVCMMLDRLMLEYETVDTLDETHNHNLRNVLKDFSDWPTIPQVYFKVRRMWIWVSRSATADREAKRATVPRRL